jgi:hypothetical protein
MTKPSYDEDFSKLKKPLPRRVQQRGAGNSSQYADYDQAKKRRRVGKPQLDYPKVHSFQVAPSLLSAKTFGREASWRRETFAKPTEILRELQDVAGLGPRVYVSLSQQPTFLLHDVVIPSLEDLATIEARRRRSCCLQKWVDTRTSQSVR